MNDVRIKIKQLIIDVLDLEDITVKDIVDSEPLFVEGLGLDSIDALELGLALKKTYDIKMDANSEETKKHFFSIDTLSAYIEQKGTL